MVNQKIRVGFFVALAVIITIVAMQNMQPVEFKILFWNHSLSFIFLFGIIFITGFIAGYVVSLIRRKSASPVDKESAELPEKKGFFKKRK